MLWLWFIIFIKKQNTNKNRIFCSDLNHDLNQWFKSNNPGWKPMLFHRSCDPVCWKPMLFHRSCDPVCLVPMLFHRSWDPVCWKPMLFHRSWDPVCLGSHVISQCHVILCASVPMLFHSVMWSCVLRFPCYFTVSWDPVCLGSIYLVQMFCWDVYI